ncbi:Serine/threonine protein kinase [Amycolatopsis marina]|uniref:non-specific serine/threonine protein kinase n=1 Tax=Amycolatopsis marina TaxID=490629 RepID=A0A1I1AD00_9PSEU|nr:serine/threonine-protein kinase [Amycolatopsis marina]SFB35881.1 Serine/threonine protein kinase [Amycolatopsis marina]
MSTAMATVPEYGELVPLGEGPVATVLAGVHEATGEAFALKVYPGRLDRRSRGELDDELSAQAAIREDSAVLVPHRVQDLPDGRLAVHMELCAQSLPELINAFGPLSIADALALGEALAVTLATAHRAGLVHGGVTPGNVLFRPSGAPVLSDFGLTLRRAFPRDPEQDVDYLPPETVRDGSADERADLYGLGAILYLALSGRSPHQGRTGEQPGELMLRVLGGTVPPLERADLPSGLGQLVSALLEKNPDARPLDAATVASRLSMMIGPQGTQTQLDRPAFDDFAAAVPPPRPAATTAPPPVPYPVGPPPAPPRALGQPILEYGPNDARRRKSHGGLILAIVGGLSVLAVVAVLLLMYRPDELDAPPAQAETETPTPATASAAAVQLELNNPVDKGNYVELSWRSSEPLDYAVIVAPEGKENETIFVQRNTTYRVPVDPVLKYCFLVQGVANDGRQTFESQAKQIRDANCSK